MNKHCYCLRPLEYDEDVPNLNCKNCCRDLSPVNDEAVYTCFEDESKCIFREMDGFYYVCSDCYEEENNEIKNDWDHGSKLSKVQFILRKFTYSIASSS